MIFFPLSLLKITPLSLPMRHCNVCVRKKTITGVRLLHRSAVLPLTLITLHYLSMNWDQVLKLFLELFSEMRCSKYRAHKQVPTLKILLYICTCPTPPKRTQSRVAYLQHHTRSQIVQKTNAGTRERAAEEEVCPGWQKQLKLLPYRQQFSFQWAMILVFHSNAVLFQHTQMLLLISQDWESPGSDMTHIVHGKKGYTVRTRFIAARGESPTAKSREQWRRIVADFLPNLRP